LDGLPLEFLQIVVRLSCLGYSALEVWKYIFPSITTKFSGLISGATGRTLSFVLGYLNYMELAESLLEGVL